MFISIVAIDHRFSGPAQCLLPTGAQPQRHRHRHRHPSHALEQQCWWYPPPDDVILTSPMGMVSTLTTPHTVANVSVAKSTTTAETEDTSSNIAKQNRMEFGLLQQGRQRITPVKSVCSGINWQHWREQQRCIMRSKRRGRMARPQGKFPRW